MRTQGLLLTGLISFTVCHVLTFSSKAAEPLTIENETLQVRYDEGSSSFSLFDKSTGVVFLTNGKLTGEGGDALLATTGDHGAGQNGEMMLISYPNGNRDCIQVYAGVPFVLFSSTIHNGGQEDIIVNRFPLVSGELNLPTACEQLRSFGTAGLTALEKNPGSYAYLAIVDPATRAGIVSGWLTHDRGSGVVFSGVKDQRARIEARIDYGRLRLKPGQPEGGEPAVDTPTETFALGWFDDARQGLETYADRLASNYSIKLPPQPAGYCTWYADQHGGACDEKHLAELAAYAAEQLKPYGFEFVQIDDGWQDGVSTNGPCRNFTAHRPEGPYPSGMQATASTITRLGLTPGIWFMPFAGTSYDPFFKDHQDWFAKDQQGKPFETTWGGTCLDMTHPGAQQHLRWVVRRIAHEWGYRFFKMDGLWTGTATRLMYVNDGYQDDQMGEASLSNPDQTAIEAYRDGLKLVRQEAGPEVFLLGCCVSQNMRSLGGSFGLVDAMRVGPDTGAGHIGAPHGSRNYFLHGRVWYNDPDCVSVRAGTPLHQAQLNASWTAISGQLFYCSDWLPGLPAERLRILQCTMPAHGLQPRPVDLFESDPARVWLLTDRRAQRRDVVALYNWDQQHAATVDCSAASIGLPAASQYVAFDFWADKFVPPVGDSFSSELPAASCRILAVRPVAEFPQLLSTSRHVTQGMVDVLEEIWDGEAQTLRGTSRVVGGGAYELRVVVPTGENSWLARDVRLGDDDWAAGVTAEFQQTGPKLRARISSPVSRNVQWQIRFEPGEIQLPTPDAVTDLRAVIDYDSVTLTWSDTGADSYRITRSDGETYSHALACFSDVSIQHAAQYRYSVQAVGWNGDTSSPVSIDVVTPAELKPPAAPPKPDVPLSQLTPVLARQGWGTLGIDKSVEGKPLIVAGQPYERGLGTHAESLLVYAIPSGAKRFVAVVGLDDEKLDDPRSSVTFEVYGDVKEMGESPVLLAKSPVLCQKTLRRWAFDTELNERFRELRLVVTDAGDGIAADHADLVDAGFVMH